MKKLSRKFVMPLLAGSIFVGAITAPVHALNEIGKETLSSFDLNDKEKVNDGFTESYKDGKLRISKDGYRLIVIDGKLIKWPKDMDNPTQEQITTIKQEKGKFGVAIKAIRKGYSKLPPNVKKYISKYLGLNAILGTLDHWTGAIEDGLYKGCKAVGMPDWMAWTVTKALTMIAL